VPVEQLKLGDSLVTPLGKCRVRKVGVRPGQRLIRVRDGFRELICSSSHNLLLRPEQIDLMNVETLDVTGPVYYIEAEEPHVYLANGFLSHNKLFPE
jgi:intein/homing endonuclease